MKVGDTFEIDKPTLDGEIIQTGLTNNTSVEHTYHHSDPYFGDGWVNDFAWSTDTLKLKDETSDTFIMEAIKPGSAWTTCTLREINSNRSLSVHNQDFDFKVRPLVQDAAAISFEQPPMTEARFTLQDGTYTSRRILINVTDAGSDSQTLDESEFDYHAYIRDTSVVSEISVLTARPSHSNPAIVLEYKLSGAKNAGVTQVIFDLIYKGAKYSYVIPVVVCNESIENYPYTPDVSFSFPKVWYVGDVPSFNVSGKDADRYEWWIECDALDLRGATENPGIYQVYAHLKNKEEGSIKIDLGDVTVKKRGAEDPINNKLFLQETGSNSALSPAYCSEIDSELELELFAYGKCISDAQTHEPKLICELIGVTDDCPYDVQLMESYIEGSENDASYGLNPWAWVKMTPKTMPMKAGRYSYTVRYTVTCCGQTTSIDQRIPLLIVDIPKNKLDYLHTPPVYMCLDHDQILWDEDILTPINRYCSVDLIFESGAKTWEEQYHQCFRLYKPTEEGTASWKYVGYYANGDVILHSGETMIFTREEYGKLDESTNLTAIYNNFDLTPEQQDVPRLFPPNENWTNEWFLKAQLMETDAVNSICYELTLVDEYENEVALPESTTLYLPYPEGMSAEEAADYEFVVVHEAKDGTQIYSTQDGTLIKREYGLEMTVTSLSPFTINWGTEEEMNELLASGVDTSTLPQTGDNSLLTLWLFMLSLAAAALLTLSRKTA